MIPQNPPVKTKVDCYQCGETIPATSAVCPSCGNDPYEHPKETKTYWDWAREIFGTVVWNDKLFFFNHSLFWFFVFAYPMLGTHQYDPNLREHYYQFSKPWWETSQIVTLLLVFVITWGIPYVLKKIQDKRLFLLSGSLLTVLIVSYGVAAVLFLQQRMEGQIQRSDTTSRIIFTGPTDERTVVFFDYNLPIFFLGLGLLVQLWRKWKLFSQSTTTTP